MLTRPSSGCPSLPHTGIQDGVGLGLQNRGRGEEKMDDTHAPSSFFRVGLPLSTTQTPGILLIFLPILGLLLCLSTTAAVPRCRHSQASRKPVSPPPPKAHQCLLAATVSPPSGTSPTSADFWGILGQNPHLLHTLTSALCLSFIFTCTSGVDGSLHVHPTQRQETRGLAMNPSIGSCVPWADPP